MLIITSCSKGSGNCILLSVNVSMKNADRILSRILYKMLPRGVWGGMPPQPQGKLNRTLAEQQSRRQLKFVWGKFLNKAKTRSSCNVCSSTRTVLQSKKQVHQILGNVCQSDSRQSSHRLSVATNQSLARSCWQTDSLDTGEMFCVCFLNVLRKGFTRYLEICFCIHSAKHMIMCVQARPVSEYKDQ